MKLYKYYYRSQTLKIHPYKDGIVENLWEKVEEEIVGLLAIGIVQCLVILKRKGEKYIIYIYTHKEPPCQKSQAIIENRATSSHMKPP